MPTMFIHSLGYLICLFRYTCIIRITRMSTPLLLRNKMTVNVFYRRRHKKVREFYFGAWVLIKFHYKIFNKPRVHIEDSWRALVWDGLPVLFFCFCLGTVCLSAQNSKLYNHELNLMQCFKLTQHIKKILEIF